MRNDNSPFPSATYVWEVRLDHEWDHGRDDRGEESVAEGIKHHYDHLEQRKLLLGFLFVKQGSGQFRRAHECVSAPEAKE